MENIIAEANQITSEEDGANGSSEATSDNVFSARAWILQEHWVSATSNFQSDYTLNACTTSMGRIIGLIKFSGFTSSR